MIVGVVTPAVGIISESKAKSQARMYQLVQPSAEAALFGDIGTLIGSPQEFVINDEKAIIENPENPDLPYLDDTYLKENGIYPTQLKTVKFVAGLMKMGGAAAFVAGLAMMLFARSRMKKKAQEVEPTA